VEHGPKMGLRIVAWQVELRRDRLAQRIPMDADPIAREVAQLDGDGIERESIDAPAEPAFERGTKLTLEGVLEGPRAQRPREVQPASAARRAAA
jgi:hypothetical protein